MLYFGGEGRKSSFCHEDELNSAPKEISNVTRPHSWDRSKL